ncbi:gliding motility-associated C-terminal domain-containing protein [Salinimicrobium sp. TH3]|uniref:gliding motility-associated C-terminal domain-containing protein n=1 Tax=Salinimicrobium sp. TH3 TaxID=2997342 RepID=UPI002272D28E|nr:gliding motility-associated C-terminal domain-containing protein [Salinimicrobium sp. TH3]MCY2688315.1 gliding motility-associated C-terminal domain-containing protein [Salinimicrobium sp. TH3]
MRIFTLGKKGVPLLFFALFLFSGTYSYGQNCPTVSDQTQEYCYLSTVADLDATASGDDVRWYRTATSTTPIPFDELLQDESYFAGNTSGNCTERVEVAVTVDNVGPPISRFGITFQPCEYGEDDTTTVEELIDLIEGSDIAIYAEEFSGEPLPNNTPLEKGENYFAGQFSDDGCPSSRLALRYDPIPVMAPVAESLQTFCSGATVGDLQAEATSPNTQNFRWYSTRTSNPALDASTPLINGESYFVSQIINRSNSPLPPCESIERFEVQVEVAPLPFSGNFPLEFCVTEARELLQAPEDAFIYFSTLLQGEEIVVNPANFEADAFAEVNDLLAFIATPTSDSETFNFIYNNPSENTDCESGEITIDVTINNVEEANAGDFANQTVCSTDGMIDLTAFTAEAGATPGGTFSGEGVENNMFNAALGAQQGGYSITYTVSESECVTGEASSQFTINVQNAPVSGNIPLTFCIAEAQEIVQIPADAEEYITIILEDMGVNVNPVNFADGDDEELGRLFNYIQNPDSESETFNFTYTTPATTICEEGVITIEVTINQGEEANAGDFANQTVCSTDGMIDLTAFIAEAGATPGGTFSGEGVENNMFNAALGAQQGGYTITYTVNESEDDCLTGEPSSQFTINVQNAPVSGNIPLTFCIAEAQEIVQVPADAEEYITIILEDMGVSVNPVNFADGDDDELGRLFNYIQSPDSESETFNFTYTTPATTVCEEGVITIEVTINQGEEANAGDFANQTVCSTDGMIDLTAFIAEAGATPGGTFSGEGVENNMFNAALGAQQSGYTITYTISESECITGEASSQFLITVLEGDEAGDDILGIEECRNTLPNQVTQGEVRNYLLDLLNPDTTRGGTFSNLPEITAAYNALTSYPTTYSTTYTVGEGTDCESEAIIEVTILGNPDAGTPGQLFVESGDTEEQNLFDELGGTPEADGTWTFDGEEVDGSFDPATDEEGVYTYTVTSDNGCSASATVTVVIGTQEPNCPEVTVTEQTFCDSEPTVADLMPAGVLWYSSTDATEALDATTALVDGSVYYAGPVEGICDDRPSVTVTLSDSPAAPSVTPFTQCGLDGATIADLEISGEVNATFTVYSDETLTTEVGSTEELTEGTYYVTQTNVAGCVSDAASLTVSFSNSDAPVLVPNAECIPIDGTLADLEEIVSANGDITWYATATSTDPLSRMTTLTDGTIYYATSTNDEGCESSTRLAVTADFCPIVIPEIFTPNGDGINDYFAITGISAEYPNHMLEIYNRWGEPVYVGKGENPGWDGTSTEGSIGSGVLPVGVYFYILYYNDGQTAPTQGKLYLSR